jgi:hypothetical protein
MILPPESLNPGVIRPSRFAEYSWCQKALIGVIVDGTRTRALAPKTYYMQALAPGEHTLQVTASYLPDSTGAERAMTGPISITVKPSKTVFFRTFLDSSSGLLPIPPQPYGQLEVTLEEISASSATNMTNKYQISRLRIKEPRDDSADPFDNLPTKR